MIEQPGLVAATTTRSDRRRRPPRRTAAPEHRPDPSAHPSPAPWYRRHVADVAGMAAVLAAVTFLWGRARHVWYWIDEGIAIGIASEPLARIPQLLAQDGAPPLYYVLLHGWMALFGSSESATHILSLLFALACVPAALWAGWSLFGRRTGWVCAALAALNPFLAQYANETRMYALVVLLGLLTTATFLHAFVYGRRRYLPAFVACLALLLYTHNWALFLGLGLAVATALVAALVADRARVLVDGALAFGAVVLLYAPWLPTLLLQVEQSGAPWLRRPTLELVRSDLVMLVGQPEAAAVLGLGLALGLAVLVPWPWPRRAPAAATAVVATTAMIAVTVAAAWLVSRQDSVWTFRYLAVVVPPLLLVIAAGVARGGRTAAAALAVYAVLALPVDVKRQPDTKSNVRDIAEQAAPRMEPGDLVVASFGRVPVLQQYLPPGLRYAETMGLMAEGGVSDQRDAVERLQQLAPEQTLPPLLDALALGGHVLLVCPPTDILVPDDTEFVVLISRRCQEAVELVEADDRFRLDLFVENRPGVSVSPEDGSLFTKVAAP